MQDELDKSILEKDAVASFDGSLFPLLLMVLCHLRGAVANLSDTSNKLILVFLVAYMFYSLFGLVRGIREFFLRLNDKSFAKIALYVFVFMFVLQAFLLLFYYKFSIGAVHLVVLVASMFLLEPLVGAISLGVSGLKSKKKYLAVAALLFCLISLKDVGYIAITAASILISGLLGYVPF